MVTQERQGPSIDFFARLADSSERILFMDYDGTIAPFHHDPSKAVAYPQVTELLQDLIDVTNTRLIFVTGRKARDLRRLLTLQPIPEIWGTHGTERLQPDGDYEQLPLSIPQLRSLALTEVRLKSMDIESRVERKPGSLALHWRGLPAPVARRESETILAAVCDELATNGLRLLKFDGGLELRFADYTKATAIRNTFDEAAPNSIAAYLGDDDSDEDAFRALRSQDLGVLVREEFRDTAAHLWVKPPEELCAFLDAWLLACRDNHS